MKEAMKRAWPIFTVVLLVAAFSGMAWQFLTAQTLKQRALTAEARADAAEKNMAALARDKAQAERTLAEERERATKATNEPAASLAQAERKEEKRLNNQQAKRAARLGEENSGRAARGGASGWAATASDPEVMRRLNEQARLQTTRRYGPLFDQLSLSAEQREQLTKLLADKRQVPLDVAAATLQGGTDPREDPATYADMVAATREDLEQQIHAVLGDAGYQSYQNFDHGTGQAQVIDRLGQMSAQMQQPLSPSQVAQLHAVMRANDTGRVSAKVVNDAAAFLTPAQLQALKDLRAIQQANSRRRNTPISVLPATPGGK